MMWRVVAAGGLALALSGSAFGAERLRLAPYKDELFKYRNVLATSHGGDYVTIEFNYTRDVLERDDKPDEKVRPEYVSLDVKSSEVDLVLRADGTEVHYVAVGRTSGKAKAILVFLHGWQATRFDAVNDWRSGGNLNRIKNLMLRNDGVLLAPDFSVSPRKAGRQVKVLIDEFAGNSPGASVFLACASAGARACWSLLKDSETASHVGGVLLLAAVSDPAALAVARGLSKPIPIYIAHGTRDDYVDWRRQEQFFKQLKAAAPEYPVKLAIFQSGTHRAPLRMIDWRLTLNWMLEVGGY
jgi:hypothetical protein